MLTLYIYACIYIREIPTQKVKKTLSSCRPVLSYSIRSLFVLVRICEYDISPWMNNSVTIPRMHSEIYRHNFLVVWASPSWLRTNDGQQVTHVYFEHIQYGGYGGQCVSYPFTSISQIPSFVFVEHDEQSDTDCCDGLWCMMSLTYTTICICISMYKHIYIYGTPPQNLHFLETLWYWQYIYIYWCIYRDPHMLTVSG